MVSNWSSICSRGIFQPVFLPHPGGMAVLEPENHFPIILDHKTGMYNNIGWNSLVVFRYSEIELGALVMAPPSATDETGNAFLNRPALSIWCAVYEFIRRTEQDTIQNLPRAVLEELRMAIDVLPMCRALP